MHKNFKIISSVLCCFMLIILSKVYGQTTTQPNVIIILTDDQGWGDFSYTGNNYLSTPHFDKMVNESAVLDRFYVSPVCAPTRASVLTGRYHLRTGVSFVTRGRENMRTEEVTIAETFRKAGYETGCFGKWHNGAHYPENPQGQGFDTFLGFTSGHWSNYFDTELEYNGEMIATKGYITDVLTDSTLAFIDRNKEKPFLAYVPFNAPHTPYQVDDEYYNMYKNIDFGYGEKQNKKIATIYGMCKNIDDNLGRILRYLKENELEENTIVVFLSDNGPQGERYNGPWKGGKTSVHEGGTLVPCAIQWKGKITPHHENALTAHIDLMPTLMGLAKIEKEEISFDGEDLSSYLLDNRAVQKNRKLYTHMTGFEITADRGAVREGDFRFTIEYGKTGLYNLKEDPSEKENLQMRYPEKAKDMKEAFDLWFKEVTINGFSNLKIPIGYKESKRVVLAAHESSSSGALKFKANENGWAHDWYLIDGDATIKWPVEVVKTATFSVKLKYAGEKIKGDYIELVIGDKIMKQKIRKDYRPISIPTPDRVMREQEAKEQTWGIIDLGEITLSENKAIPFELKISKSGKGTLEIKELITRRIDVL